MSQEIKPLKKITLKDIGISVPAGGGDFLGKTVMMVQGIIQGSSTKAGANGEAECFFGDFNAINSLTGEYFTAPTAYFNTEFAAMLKNKLDSSENKEVEFSAEVIVAPSTRGARGYTFVYTAIRSPEVTLRRQKAFEMLASGQALLLSAPKNDGEKEVADNKKAAKAK